MLIGDVASIVLTPKPSAMNPQRVLALALLAGLFCEDACSDFPGPATATDPVCGRGVVQADAVAVREYRGQTYYFDSQACASSFDARPEDYRRRSQAEPEAIPSNQGPWERSLKVKDRD
jgi:YHS domain-containing protein